MLWVIVLLDNPIVFNCDIFLEEAIRQPSISSSEILYSTLSLLNKVCEGVTAATNYMYSVFHLMDFKTFSGHICQ